MGSFRPRPRSLTSDPRAFALSWVIIGLLSPFIFVVISVLLIYRHVVRFVAKRKHLSSPLTPYDCIFAVDSYDTRPYASNLTVLELNSRVDVGTVRHLFATRILADPRFAKLAMRPKEFGGYWFWSSLAKPLDLNKAVRVHYDTEVDETHVGEKPVDECLREIIEMPYDSELFDVCVLLYGSVSFIVFRIHHTVCDGYSFNKLIDTFVGMESKYLVKCQASDWVSYDAVARVTKELWSLATLLLHLPLHLITLYKDALTHTPNYYTLKKSSTTGRIRRTIIPLPEFRRVRRATNAHFASVGMSLMTGALQKLYDQDPNGDATRRIRPDRLSIMHSLPKRNHPLNSLCNHWGVGLFKVPFTTSPSTRLDGAEQDYNEYMSLQFDRLLHLHMPVINIVPCSVVKWFFSINFGTSCGFTSVPGLFDQIARIGGSEGVDAADGFALERATPPEVMHMWKVFGLQWKQSAVAVAMYTYRNEASVSLYANDDVVRTDAEMDRLVELFHAEFAELASSSTANLPNQTPMQASPMQTNRAPHEPISKRHGFANGAPTTNFLEPCFRDFKLA